MHFVFSWDPAESIVVEMWTISGSAATFKHRALSTSGIIQWCNLSCVLFLLFLRINEKWNNYLSGFPLKKLCFRSRRLFALLIKAFIPKAVPRSAKTTRSCVLSLCFIKLNNYLGYSQMHFRGWAFPPRKVVF